MLQVYLKSKGLEFRVLWLLNKSFIKPSREELDISSLLMNSKAAVAPSIRIAIILYASILNV